MRICGCCCQCGNATVCRSRDTDIACLILITMVRGIMFLCTCFFFVILLRLYGCVVGFYFNLLRVLGSVSFCVLLYIWVLLLESMLHLVPDQ